jgi:putative ABC transport system permease protein
LNADIEMFFLSGATMVTAGTFIVVYNADVVLPLVAAFGSRFGRIVPAVKTAVAYPLTARFRTGMTIAMIGLIMFVLSMQSALNTNFTKAFSGDDARGGFDDRLIVNGNNRADDLVGALKKANEDPGLPEKVDTSLIDAVGEVRIAAPFEVQIEDPRAKNEDERYKHFTIMGVDQRFIDAQRIPLKYRAAGYADDASVWSALAHGSALAIIPASLTTGQDGFGPPHGEDLLELDTEVTHEAFQPFPLTFRDPGTGTTTTVTVIGQTKDAAVTFWPAIIVAKDTVLQAFPDSKGQEFFVRLKPGTDSKRYAKQVEAALVQASADSLAQIIDDNMALNRGFLAMFQGFLALGLLVGIAALGVIAFRAVVERRQQIGMLRAIGYKRSMVQLSFLLESGFIALSGIGLGLVLGLTFAWNLFTSGEVGDTAQGIPFTVPWMQISIVTAFAFVASMLMTVIPARSASRVAVAEALRYE